MGERTLALKFKNGIEKSEYRVAALIDVIEWMGENYRPFAEINHDLADLGHPLIENLGHTTPLPASDLFLILSWSFSVAALFATGIHKTRPTVVKLFAHHREERILPTLYAPAALLITESLLANERALNYGMDRGKLLFLPHSYPTLCENVTPNRDSICRLAEEQGKTIKKSTLVIGCVGRFEYGKNCEYAVEAVRRLALKGKEVVLLLKGNFPKHSTFPDYQPLFSQMLAAYEREPWLVWDQRETPFPQVIEEYSSFDLLLHPSGAEGGSHVVIECLGLHKPVVVLDCSTQPYLFKNVAHFVKTTGEIRNGPLPFYVPDLDDLCRVLEGALQPPDPKIVESRFHERRLQERIPLLFHPDPIVIKELYDDDRHRFDL